jgi:integrase
MSVHGPKGGPYVVRWRNDEGKQKGRTFDLKGDADEWDREMRRLKQRGHLHRVEAGRTTLSEFVANTMLPDHLSRLAPRTQAFYRELLAAHILKELGPVPLRSLTPKRIREWQSRRLAAGAGRSNLNRALSLLGMILQRAAEDGELDANPVALVRRVEQGRRDVVLPLSPRTIEIVRSHLELRDRTIVSLLAYAGLRPGELYALRWQDVGRRAITVQRAVDGRGDVKRTKTGNVLPVKLLAPLVEDLREWRKASDGPKPGALLFPIGPAGSVASKTAMDNWRKRAWTDALEAAGVPYQRPYDLRHSFASLLLAAGHTVHYVASQLRNSPKLVLSTYGHVIAEFEGQPAIDPVAAIEAARDIRRRVALGARYRGVLNGRAGRFQVRRG